MSGLSKRKRTVGRRHRLSCLPKRRHVASGSESVPVTTVARADDVIGSRTVNDDHRVRDTAVPVTHDLRRTPPGTASCPNDRSDQRHRAHLDHSSTSSLTGGLPNRIVQRHVHRPKHTVGTVKPRWNGIMMLNRWYPCRTPGVNKYIGEPMDSPASGIRCTRRSAVPGQNRTNDPRPGVGRRSEGHPSSSIRRARRPRVLADARA